VTISGAIIIGAGPGIGVAVSRRVAREGLAVGMIARSQATVDAATAALSGYDVLGVAADATDEDGLRAALDQIVAHFGVPDLLVYNGALVRADALGELTAQQQLDAWAVNVVAAITATAHLAPRMALTGAGTILFTGGMPDPDPDHVSLSLGKAGLRTLTELLAKAYRPAGLHVATVIVTGEVTRGGARDPDEIAEQYWRLHSQPRGAWEREILYAGRPT
jgi:NAD(P)-dependent dehydrogenase (short-subunit alcohol dehydrogenase family)